MLFTSGQYHGAMPRELPYIASKAVVQQLTASLAVELAPRRITVNCVNPGPNDTGYADPTLHRFVEEAMPGGRWGQAGGRGTVGVVAVRRRRRLGDGPDHRLGRRLGRQGIELTGALPGHEASPSRTGTTSVPSSSAAVSTSSE